MKSKRLSLLVKIEEANEKEEARKFAKFQKTVQDSQNRLSDLEAYLDDYRAKFAVLTRRGAEARKIRSSYAFISQLNQAISQQQKTVRELENAADEYRQNWLNAKQRMDIMEKTITKFRDEELRQEEKKEQLFADEVARHKPSSD